MKDVCQKSKVKLIFRGAYRLSGTGIVECLEINVQGCNLKQFEWLDLTDASCHCQQSACWQWILPACMEVGCLRGCRVVMLVNTSVHRLCTLLRPTLYSAEITTNCLAVHRPAWLSLGLQHNALSHEFHSVRAFITQLFTITVPLRTEPWIYGFLILWLIIPVVYENKAVQTGC